MSVGFYGKLPSHGDFLHRSVGDEFVNRWDAWLQEGIAQSRRDLGDAWLDIFLTSPVWHFALATGVIGGSAWAGILLPSVDRVGRYFPLTIVAELPLGVLPFEVSVAGRGWFERVEAVARRVLEDELVDLDRLEAELRASDTLLDGVRQRAAPLGLDALADGNAPVWSFDLASDGDMGRFFARFADGLASAAREPLGLWWSVGSERIAPTVRMSAGLPPATAFKDMLGGSGASAYAETYGSLADTIVDLLPEVSLWSVSPSRRWRSAALTDVGRWRDENQDGFVERSADGFWAVADGMGGHQGGGFASSLIGEHLHAIVLGDDLDVAAELIDAAISAANEALRQRAVEEAGFDGGSTVVAFCAREDAGIALWAGDSRLYRLRAGDLVQLTRDHSVAEESGGSPADNHEITRAVGGTDALVLEEIRFGVLPGDRFLLCSDGLYGDLLPAEIAERLGAADCAAAAASLIALALERGGRDNATAVVIEAVDCPSGTVD